MTLDDDWMDSGACRDYGDQSDNIFFPEVLKGHNNPRVYIRAKQICETCPVRTHCLSFAIAHSVSSGVWGGLTPNERSHISRNERLRIRRAWYSRYPNASRIRY